MFGCSCHLFLRVIPLANVVFMPVLLLLLLLLLLQLTK